MLILGLDQSPRGTGWAYGDGSCVPKFGYREFADYQGDESALMDHIFDWLVTFGKSIGVDAVFTEQIIVYPQRIEMQSLHRQFAVYDAIAFACGSRGLRVPHYQADLTTWRMRFIGSRGAPRAAKKGFLKDAAIRAAADRGWLTDNHHTAEAIGIWDYGLAELDANYEWSTRAHVRRQREKATTELAQAKGAFV